MTVFGTRPEAIKMAPIVKKLNEKSEIFDSITTNRTASTKAKA